MAAQRPNRLKEIAIERGVTIETLIPRTVSEEGSVYGAAVKLGVSRNTVSYWLKKMNIKVETNRVTTLEHQPKAGAV